MIRRDALILNLRKEQTYVDMPAKDVTKKDPRAWDALTPPLSGWTLDAIKTMGFTRMTPVQASTIPLFMGNKDVVVEVRSHGEIDCPNNN